MDYLRGFRLIEDDPQGGCLVECVCGSQFSDRGKVRCPSCRRKLIYLTFDDHGVVKG